ncbi:MAG: phosphoribosylamine--glycine ligase [Vicinamibacterales bacterium]
MRILVVGSGAREHALCWKFAQEPGVTAVLAAPGNPGTAELATNIDVGADAVDDLIRAVERERIDFTVVGPEAPLALGLVDRLASAGHLAFGPSRLAARLETSKAFAKEFMHRHGVPSARFVICHTPEEAHAAARRFGLPVVLKADGLAAGKGVVIAEDEAAVRQAIDAAMISRTFGSAGDCLVVEECLSGPEASFFVLCDGRRGVPIGTAQDHKRVFDGDRGPNTGGMGAFAPAVVLDASVSARIESDIVQPVLRGMASEGCPFVGFLYVGLMLTASGPRVIEFNVRFGDPEAQVVLPALAEPLANHLLAAASGRLDIDGLRRTNECVVGVVLASGGYPGVYERGHRIAGVDRAAQTSLVFHAGTARRDGRLVTDGGRVLTVVGRGATYDDAMRQAYRAADCIDFQGRHLRRDIGRKALPQST